MKRAWDNNRGQPGFNLAFMQKLEKIAEEKRGKNNDDNKENDNKGG